MGMHAASNVTVLLVGAGPMAIEYAKVLQSRGITPTVVGRGDDSATKFEAETHLPVCRSGIDSWRPGDGGQAATHAIVAVGEKWVGVVARTLMERGIRNLLIEKPGGYDEGDIRLVHAAAAKVSAAVYVGYNRRFFASVEAARQMIAEDGSVSSFNFEFTEWGHIIADLEKEEGVKQQWFLANSTHVIDLAFHLGGSPSEMASFSAGGVPWHPLASAFAGAGRTLSGALFSYQANWQSPGRWGVEVLTPKHRIILRPLEKLQVQKLGSIAIESVGVDDALDKAFKPGLYKQVQAFLAGDSSILPTMSDQIGVLDWFLRIRGDKD